MTNIEIILCVVVAITEITNGLVFHYHVRKQRQIEDMLQDLAIDIKVYEQLKLEQKRTQAPVEKVGKWKQK